MPFQKNRLLQISVSDSAKTAVTLHPDPKLLAPLARAHRWLKAIRSGRDIAGLAKADGISEGCLRVHLQLALLAPAIQQAILDGTQPEGLTLHRLSRPEMPADWQAQSRRAGICPA